MIAFCTTAKNRDFHLAQTLPKNLQDNPSARSKFIVLDYGSQDDLLTLAHSHRVAIEFGKLAIYSYRAPGAFRMAHAKNMAHRLGLREGADILVNLDADNYLGAGYENFVAEQMRSDTFLWAGYVKGLGRKFRGVSGRIAVTRGAFLKAGGYDEKYNTWSPDDQDMINRLECLGYEAIATDRRFLEAIPHGPGIRFRDYPEAQIAEGGETARLPRPGSGIANYGNVGCGEVFHFGTGETVRLKPFPTRIFGIGLHKTATSSLHAAFQTLGFESAHWPSGAWARDVWDEMRASGKSPTLEKSYAASDLPVSILYKELDRAYPGSKFILTIRDEASWLQSVRRHFSWDNPYRWEWDVYPISDRIHQALYGRRDFDETVFLERYRRHNAEVREYFRNRPDDLLVMERPAWPELCRFLERPIPGEDYPRKLVSRG